MAAASFQRWREIPPASLRPWARTVRRLWIGMAVNRQRRGRGGVFQRGAVLHEQGGDVAEMWRAGRALALRFFPRALVAWPRADAVLIGGELVRQRLAESAAPDAERGAHAD